MILRSLLAALALILAGDAGAVNVYPNDGFVSLPPPLTGAFLLEDGSSILLLEDNSSFLCLEGGC